MLEENEIEVSFPIYGKEKDYVMGRFFKIKGTRDIL